MKNIKGFFEFINENINNNHSGRYIELEVVPNGLWLHLTEEGRKEAEENKDDENHCLCENNFYEYFEDIQVNSEWLYHHDMGTAGFGLTEAPGFTDGYYIDDDGELTDKGHEFNSEAYWFPNYMVENFCETLMQEGKVFFDLATDQSAGSDEMDSPNG